MPITPRELIANLGDLPPLPQVAVQVLKLAADPDATTHELQHVIGTDQALTAQILKIANSAMFGMMREVRTLTQAIMTLGFSTIKSVVIASSAKNLYNRGAAGLQERMMWEHALFTAITARAYGRGTHSARVEEAFLAGLMHDIGKSVMALKFPERYGALIRTVYNEQGDLVGLELDTFGFDHCMVGEALLDAWNLAPSLGQAARWHHDPPSAPPDSQDLVALVALGNRLALEEKVGLGRLDSLDAARQSSMDILGLDADAMDRLRETAIEAVSMDKALLTEF